MSANSQAYSLATQTFSLAAMAAPTGLAPTGTVAAAGGFRHDVPRRPPSGDGIDGELVGSVNRGLLVLLGITHQDDERAADRLAAKVRALRVFPDEKAQMNEALGEREILCVSQFTLYGDTRRGNRPSYVTAAGSEQAEPLYERFCARAGARGGVFGANMSVELVNEGPVTLLLEL